MRVLRHTDEWVGLLVLLTVALFVAAVLEGHVLGDWFRPVAELRVLLPEAGSQGLSAGADVELLGTKIGTIREVVIDPNQHFYADIQLEQPATSFIRRDSSAIIKKRFGIAGAAYLDITRGVGASLDWKFAVIEAVSERDPNESLSALIDDVKRRVLPIIDDAGRAMHAMADTAESVSQGHGDVGKLVKEDIVVNELTRLFTTLDTTVAQANSVIAEIRAAALYGTPSVPTLLQQAESVLASLQSASRDFAKTTPMLPGIARHAAGAATNLPALLTQTQQSMAELEKLLVQLRHTWPLSNTATQDTRRLSPSEVRP